MGHMLVQNTRAKGITGEGDCQGAGLVSRTPVISSVPLENHKILIYMARPTGFEPVAPRLGKRSFIV
jgi:hypothetical protein